MRQRIPGNILEAQRFQEGWDFCQRQVLQFHGQSIVWTIFPAMCQWNLGNSEAGHCLCKWVVHRIAFISHNSIILGCERVNTMDGVVENLCAY
jgi:hypothetical protein